MTRQSRPANASGSESSSHRGANNAQSSGAAEASGAALDGGWGWIVVTASFIVNCIVDGFCYSFAIFYVQLLEEFKESSAKTTLVGSLLPGMYLIVGPLVGGLTNKFGCRSVTIVGSLLASAAIFVSSFSVDLNMLIVTYGVVTGIGFGMMYLPSIVIVGFYFERYRALATGIAVCGSGIGAFIFAPLSRLLLDCFGWRGGNQILAGIILNGVICGAVYRPLTRPRRFSEEDRKPAVVVERASERPRRRFEPKRGLIMQKIIDEKQRQRTISTGSLDGTIITKDNRLIRPSELSLHESLHSLKVSGGQGVLETIPEVNLQDYRYVPTAAGAGAGAGAGAAAGAAADGNASNSAGKSAPYGSATVDGAVVGSSKQLAEAASDAIDGSSSVEPFISNLTLSVGGDTMSRKDQALSRRPSLTFSSKFRPQSWLSTASNNDQPLTDSNADVRSQAARALYRHDTFYSGSILNIPDVRRNPEMAAYVSTPSIQQPGGRRVSGGGGGDGGKAGSSPVVAICKMMLDFSLAKSLTFILLCTALVLPFLGFFTPFVYLPPYSLSLGVTEDDATLLLSILGLSNALGRLVVGFLSDRSWVDCVLVHNAALIFAGILTGVVPMLSTYDLLCIFAVLFGLCVASFVTLKSILLVELLGLQKLTTAFGLVGFFQGFATLIGGPLAGAVFDFTGSYVASFLMAGSLIAAGGLLCLPVRRVSRWEMRRGSSSSPPTVGGGKTVSAYHSKSPT